ncbi:CaiB/BaiF CoA-transferase family protein [Agriterribacter sp.]|uniref:CaiB/BaiF CoA transferase family protein n=1 Tax=Agriterribacter sp. TaxID=2821509 RepID=UPI002B642BE6|nr:CaiB/BaiF CoA-transferase family protein [Agriterribacter sp.]HRO45734.1 CaiB/BaiF CoA-transferase family protein [Agriterribacter sp.]HRQ15788.1 CaiB/BaiF CoA-transferase family protein [Agriterribacter sp.]
MHLPLKGIVVLEFSQYLSGPCAGLRLADLGAHVIKIERPQKGEAGRKLAIKNLWAGESSLLFHTINRNKDSFTADLNDADDMKWIKLLIREADIITHNFRPGIMEKKGLHYEAVKAINPGIIYTEISGYGKEGPWKNKPGQDLLIQSLSGLTHSTGNYHDNPLPFGLGIGDYLCGNQAVQFILAALIRKKKTGQGALLQLSLMETLIDFQFEFFTTYFQSKRHHKRSAINNGHSLLSAPYGIYQTIDGYIAIAMMPLHKLNAAIACEALKQFEEKEAFEKRDEIKAAISTHLLTGTTASWLKKTQPLDLWVMPVLNWRQLKETEGYKVLQMEQKVQLSDKAITTTRCPVRINGQLLLSDKPAPAVGQHTENIKAALSLKL